MPKLTFYRQGRADGAIRTGIELDDDTIFENYEEGGHGGRSHALVVCRSSLQGTRYSFRSAGSEAMATRPPRNRPRGVFAVCE